MLHKERELFHGNVAPREGIVEAVQKQLSNGAYKGKTIHLCFTCDPYPMWHDTAVTRAIITAIKGSDAHVQILTKSGETRDLDLLDEHDWFGVSYAGYPCILGKASEEPCAEFPVYRLAALERAHEKGIKTWISMEPVLNAEDALHMLRMNVSYIDRYKIGKLNYHPSDIDWRAFGREVERVCRKNKYDYYIKDGLRKEMIECDP